MSTQAALRIEPKNHREQEMLDVLLTHPWRVTDRELNPRHLKGKQKAIDAWIAAGLLTRNGTFSWSEYALAPGVIHDDQVRDAYARGVKETWRTLTDARARLDAAHAAEAHAAQALVDVLAGDTSDMCAQVAGAAVSMREQVNAIVRPLDNRSPIEIIVAESFELARVRDQIDARGYDWDEILTRAQDMLAEEQAAEDAAAAALAAIDPEADPLGGDA